MSAFELKRLAVDGADLSEVDTNVRAAALGTREITDALAGRFTDLELSSISEDAAFYLGRDLEASNSNPQVVIKVPTFDSQAQLQLFRLESLAASRLFHPNIIQSGEAEELEGVDYSVVEYVPGVLTLEDVLNREGWLDVDQAVGILKQIGDALAHAHQLGILHLRIHPGNILIDGNGMALLADFGIEARPELDWAHRHRAAKCPVHYISPEQINGKSLDFRSDLYSLGVVFYQMLTDRLPIDSKDRDAIRQKHLTQSPLPPHLYNSDIPPVISILINRLLEKNPNNRFQELSSFRAELAKFGKRPIDSVSIHEDSPQMVQASADQIESAGQIESAHQMESADRIESADHMESADQMESVEQMESGDAYEPDPIDLNNLPSYERREAWESPSITVIEAPVEEWSGSAALSDQTVVEDAAISLEDAREDGFIYPVLAGQAHIHNFSTQLRPIVMVVILAAAVVTGIIVLARADRFGSVNQSPLDSPVNTQRGGENQKPALPPQTPDSASMPAGQSRADQPGRVADPASNLPAPGSRGLRPPKRSVQTPSTTRRTRKPRRSWRRSTQYFSKRYRSRKLRTGRTRDVHGVLRPERDSFWINAKSQVYL